jgi:hypothetical protein
VTSRKRLGCLHCASWTVVGLCQSVDYRDFTSNNVTRISVSPTEIHVGVFNGSGFCTYQLAAARSYEQIFPVVQIGVCPNLLLDDTLCKIKSVSFGLESQHKPKISLNQTSCPTSLVA